MKQGKYIRQTASLAYVKAIARAAAGTSKKHVRGGYGTESAFRRHRVIPMLMVI